MVIQLRTVQFRRSNFILTSLSLEGHVLTIQGQGPHAVQQLDQEVPATDYHSATQKTIPTLKMTVPTRI